MAGAGVEAGTGVAGGAVGTGVLGRLGAAGTGVLGSGVATVVGGGVTLGGVAVASGVLLGTPPTGCEPPPDGAGAAGRLFDAEPWAPPWWN
ncbi:MAG: hypothetical protein J2P43_08505 [Candidatus Dormibacteraeota bacterium]|nr:hypothetical protein [Candidatus Dormibacteraeota bacterium]